MDTERDLSYIYHKKLKRNQKFLKEYKTGSDLYLAY